MPKEYHIPNEPPKKLIWRNGKPYVTENMDQHFLSRGSGRYGSGLYAYLTAHKMLGLYDDPQKNWQQNFESKPHCQLDVSDITFFTPTNLKDLEAFSDNMRDIAWDMIKTPIEKRTNQWMRKFIEIVDKIDLNDDSVIQLIKDGLYLPKDRIYDAILKTVECTETKDENLCSQPINHLLLSNGFEGVEPVFDDAEDNHHGIVVFQERINQIRNINTTKKEFKGKTEVIGNSNRYDPIGKKFIDDPNPSPKFNENDFFECQINSFDQEALIPILQQEKSDPYLGIMQTIPELIRKDYRERLFKEMNTNKEKSPIKINNRMQQSCNNWEGTTEDTPNCKKLHDYWDETLKKAKKN